MNFNHSSTNHVQKPVEGMTKDASSA
uniref:Uncharacterized protein n=1 Tax=Arundo donax TaxID=35708 RepID=A0A0A8Z8X1_ARUDO